MKILQGIHTPMKNEGSFFGPQDHYATPNYTDEKIFRHTANNSAVTSPTRNDNANLDFSVRKNIIKNIATKIHDKHMYNTNGFSKLGLNVNKIEEFAKS